MHLLLQVWCSLQFQQQWHHVAELPCCRCCNTHGAAYSLHQLLPHVLPCWLLFLRLLLLLLLTCLHYLHHTCQALDRPRGNKLSSNQRRQQHLVQLWQVFKLAQRGSCCVCHLGW